MKIKSKIADKEGLDRILTRIAHEILEKNKGSKNLVLIGMRTRGEYLAKRLRNKLIAIEGIDLPLGVLDVTLYRDDFRKRIKQPQVSVSDITFDVNEKDVILVDDVLYTGRTVRSALNAIMDLGRPSSIQLCILVDRGHRELPIRADYVGKNIPTSQNEEIKLKVEEFDGEDAIYLIESENKWWSFMPLSSRHLLGMQNVPKEDIQLILDTANTFKEILDRPIKRVPTLQGKTVVNLFYENSTRTRISFELAEKRLSADAVNFSVSTSSVTKGESLKDTVKNIEAMKVDMIVIRHSVAGTPLMLTQLCDSNVINAGDGVHEHPTQALLDLYTIREKLGKLENLKVCIVGDIAHSRVALSNIFALKTMGAKVSVCGPSTMIPKQLEDLGVNIIYSIDEAIQENDVLNVLRIQLERKAREYFPSIREYSNYFGITQERLEKCGKEILILHPGPINRGVELSSEVADGLNQIILRQVTNGVAVRMAVLYLLGTLNWQDKKWKLF